MEEDKKICYKVQRIKRKLSKAFMIIANFSYKGKKTVRKF